MKGALHCESEYNRGAGCGKTARPDLYGGLYVNEVPTISVSKNNPLTGAILRPIYPYY